MSDLDQKGLEAASMAAMWGHDLSKEERAERIVRAYLASAAPEKDEPVAFTGNGSLRALSLGEEGYIWPTRADAHPIPLYLRSSRPEEDGWRPIETAPKDGTDILLWSSVGVRGDGGATIGRWTSEEECRRQIGDCGGECRCPEYEYDDPSWISWDGGFTLEHPPTHWRPLPPPPALSTGEGK